MLSPFYVTIMFYLLYSIRRLFANACVFAFQFLVHFVKDIFMLLYSALQNLSVHLHISTRKLCYREDYRTMHLTAQSDNTLMVCC